MAVDTPFFCELCCSKSPNQELDCASHWCPREKVEPPQAFWSGNFCIFWSRSANGQEIHNLVCWTFLRTSLLFCTHSLIPFSPFSLINRCSHCMLSRAVLLGAISSGRALAGSQDWPCCFWQMTCAGLQDEQFLLHLPLILDTAEHQILGSFFQGN